MGTAKMKKVDLCVIQDLPVAEVFLKREEKPAVPTVVVIDQVLPPNSPEVSKLHKELREKAMKENIPFYYGKGMCGLLLVSGLLKPGQTAVVCDKAAAAAGALGAEVYCADEKGLEAILETGELPLETEEEAVISLRGSLKEGVSAKDLALYLVKKAGTAQIKNKLLKLKEDPAGTLDQEQKMTVCALLVQIGAVSATFEDSEAGELLAADLSEVEVLAALPSTYEHIEPLGNIPPEEVKSVFIGGTTGGRLSDLEKTASAVKGRTIAYGRRLVVAPADAETYVKAADAGYITDIMEAGGVVINHCGNPKVMGRIGKQETMVSNDLENAPEYAGFDTSRVYITSTEAAVEAALSGSIGLKEVVQAAEEEETEERSLVFEGRCWKFGNDIDTDIIIPTQHLNYATMDEIKVHAFEPLRPELAAQLREGDLIVAGNNFGCGSSREQAAEVLVANGVHCVIAKSFARIFFRNAINNGILLLECADLADNVEEGDTIKVELDKQQITANGKTYEIPAVPENLYHIIMDGGLVKSIEKKVEKGLL